MIGKNRGIWLFVLLSLATSLVATGCSTTATRKSNPLGAELDPESTVIADNSTRNPDPNAPKADSSILPVVNIYGSSNLVGVGTKVNLRAEAIDPTGAPVTLNWSATDGVLTNIDGTSANWQAPTTPSCSIVSCTATDVRGGQTKAEYKIDVIGNSVYRLNILADRTSFDTNISSENPDNAYLPVAGARVYIKALNSIDITDRNGNVEFSVNQTNQVATYSDIEVSYRDWDITYNAKLVTMGGNVVRDNLVFSPGFENVSVAQGSGDSFDLKKGTLEVSTTERNAIGGSEVLPEVTVNCSIGRAVSDRESGTASIISTSGFKETSVYLSKVGYSSIKDCKVPISQNSATLVSAQLNKNGYNHDRDAVVSWIKPYSYKKGISVMEPFVIGFGQPMVTETAFNSINLMVQNKNTDELIPLTSTEIKEIFNIRWEGNSIAYLEPIKGYKANTRYSIQINNWFARTLDGRLLKNYIGTYYEFETDADPEPQIIGFEPANGEEKVSRSGPFALNFDVGIQPDSLYENTEIEIVNTSTNETQILNESTIRTLFSIVWRDNNTRVEFVPNRTLPPWTTYQLRIKKCGFKSASGRAMNGLENIWTSFTTGGL